MPNHTFTLKDARALSYAEYGDPKGKPLFFFHGWPSSRLHGPKVEQKCETIVSVKNFNKHNHAKNKPYIYLPN